MNYWIIHSVAYFMADIIEGGLTDEGELPLTANITLHEIFGDVPEESRGEVYLKLLEILDERGVDFENDQANIN